MKRPWIPILCAIVAAGCMGAKSERVPDDESLPTLGTTFQPLPDGPGKSLIEGSCNECHSADMIVQQRLTEEQWTSTVEKMIRWGARADEEQKVHMIKYLAGHFGPDNRFEPMRTRPARPLD